MKNTKNRKNRGFTLTELLIVVVIIAVLVAISIPIFSAQLEKARETDDIADMRNAYAELSVNILSEDGVIGTKSNPSYWTGAKLTNAITKLKYGKGTAKNGKITYSACKDYVYDPTLDYTNAYIVCWYEDNTVHVHWNGTKASSNTDNDNSDNTGNDDIISRILTNAKDLPTKDELAKNNSSVSLKAGTFYKYNGKTYYVTNNVTFNQYYYDAPPETCSTWLYISPTSKTLTSSDITSDNQLLNVETGDFYKDGDTVYIRKSSSTHADPPTVSTQEWYKIN